MGTTTKTLLAAGCLGAIGLFFYGFGQDPTPLQTSVAGSRTASAADAASSNVLPEERTTVREAALPPADTPSWLDHPYTLALDVRVVDRLGLPVPGHTLRLGPTDCPLNRAIADTGPDGHVLLSWRSRVQSGEVVIRDVGDTLRRVPLQHGQTAALTVVGNAAMNLQTLFTGQGNGTLTFTISGLQGGNFVLNSTGRTPKMREGMHPHAVFTAAAGERSPATATWARSTSVIRFDGASGFKLEMGGAETAPEEVVKARIAGTVFGADGKPAAAVHVALLAADSTALFHTKTDDTGQFVFKDLLPGEFVVRAGGDDQGLATAPAITTTGTTPATLQLERGATVRGRAEKRDGSPFAKARVTWQAADGSWSDTTEAGDDGTFVLANLPGTPGTVMVWEAEDGRSFPIAFARDVLCDAGELLLREPERASELRIEPMLPDDLAGLPTIRIWDLDTGVGTTVREPKDGAIWRLAGLRAGWYRIEISHPATGTVDGGRHWVDGKADCDLGRVTVPLPAKVHLVFDEPAESERVLELYRIRDDLDVHVAVPPDGITEVQLLEPGDYALFWVDASEAVHIERFTAEAGKEVTVRIPG